MFFLNNSDENKGNLCKIILTTFEYSGGGGGGGGGITCICRDEMCHYFGYFLGCFRIFGYLFWVIPGLLDVIFLVKFYFFRNNPDFWVLILTFY